MNVEHTLARGRIAVHDDPVAFVGYAFSIGYRARGRIQTTDDRLIVLGNIIDRRNVSTRNNNDVRGCLGIDVAKCDRRFRLKDNVGRYVAVKNFAKQTI